MTSGSETGDSELDFGPKIWVDDSRVLGIRASFRPTRRPVKVCGRALAFLRLNSPAQTQQTQLYPPANRSATKAELFKGFRTL
jgi:hypothetical protein